MSVLINTNTGLAEDFGSPEAAQQALTAGQHHIPLNDPQGNPVTAPLDEAQKLMSEGYSQPSPEQLNSLLKHAKFSSPSQQAKTFLEGAAEASTFGVSPAIEKAFGVKPEDIAARKETNPSVHGLGQGAGLIAGAVLPGPSEAKLLGKAGEAAAEAVGFTGKTLVSRATATGIKNTVEMAMLQGGDEVAKAMIQDPEQSANSALVNIGMAGLLGGAIGGAGHLAVEPLWNAAKGAQVTRALEALKGKALSEGMTPQMSDEAAQLLSNAERLGINIPPSIRSVIAGGESAKGFGAGLREAATRGGKAYQQDLKAFEDSAKDKALQALGKSEEDVGAGFSDYERGTQARDALASELKGQIDPVTAKFEPIREKFQATKLPEGSQSRIAEDLGQLAVKEGYTLSESSPALKEINRAIEDLKNIHTLEDLRKYQAVARSNAGDIGGYKLGKEIVGVLRNAEEDALNTVMGKEAPELVFEHATARKGYKEVMDQLDSLNDRLHVGKYWGPASFLKNLSEMAPEDVLRRLRGLNDADLLKTLADRFPKTAEAVRGYHTDQLLQKVTSQGSLDTRKLYRVLDKMSPEVKGFALPEGSEKTLNDIRQVLQQLPERLNPSGTAKGIDTLMKHVPGGVGSMVSLATGHNPLVGMAMGHLAREIGREAPDAAKLAFLRILGSDAPISAGGFRALFKFTEAAYKGAKAIEMATKAVFRPEAEVVSKSMMPTPRQLETISKAVKAASNDPTVLQNTSGETGHYLPDQAVSLGSTAARTVQYLNSLRPNTEPGGILDKPRVPNEVEKARYDRALAIAQQPLIVLQHIKDNTLLPNDIKDLSTMHPGLYKHLQSEIVNKLTDRPNVPYGTAINLSLFLQQPLESSIMSVNVMMNQSVGQGMAAQQQTPISHSKANFKGLAEVVRSEQLPVEARVQRKIK